MIIVLVTKSELFRLKHNFRKSIEDDCIRRVINYISLNISQKISIEELTKLAGIGQTTFFKLHEFNK
jgi:predicted AAA+ superfamily ATPase